ncbi:hypothetical protein KH400_22445, partial [Desertibacillus haloalkaliphilus]|nr:hypothetical protein [Desertibacillus haloalkaliphilus]
MFNELIEQDDLIVTTYTGEIVIVKKVDVKDDRWEKERTLNTIRIWMTQLTKIDSTIKVAIGSYHPTFKKLYQSFIEAKETMVVGEKLAPEKKVLLYDDLSIYVFM